MEDAKQVRAKGRSLQVAVLAVAVLAVLVQWATSQIPDQSRFAWIMPAAKIAAYLCAITSLSCQVIRWHCQRSATEIYALANTIKRRAMLIDAFGPSQEQLDIRLLRELAGDSADTRARELGESKSYYTSIKPYGMERLRDNLQESAFFSHRLYSKAARQAFVTFGSMVVATIVGLLILVGVAPREVGVVIANGVLAMIASMVSADYLGQALNWSQASATVERIERRLEQVTGDAEESSMAAFADYEAATATAPAIPTWLYEQQRKRLTSLWGDESGK